ncbi:MAG: DinB family protein [Dehalococcoidia bacterium]
MTLDDIVAALEATPPVLARLVHGLSDEALRAGHGDDRWAIKEVIWHLRDADEVSLERFSRMAGEEAPFLPAYDQEAYARDRRYLDADAAAGLTAFAAIRGRTVSLFRGLSPADLARPGRHEETGPITIGGLAEHVISHDLVHLAQIARTLV